MKKPTLLLYFGDLVHDWGKTSNWTFPLNLAYIATYAQKHFPNQLEIVLFKRSLELIEAIKKRPPNLIGLSHYVWNANLNRRVFEIAHDHNPQVFCVGGGPNITELNRDPASVQKFFQSQKYCDAYVYDQGERGFVALLEAFFERGLHQLADSPVPGCAVYNENTHTIKLGEILKPLSDLDEIPSPYLNGLLDPFFKEPFIPIIESNRSCPYRCTFCAWGIGSKKLTRFSTERVLAEIAYIGERCTKSAQLSIADANFGILDRDQEIAKALYHSHKVNGFPGHLGVQWNKTRPDRVQKTARELHGLADVGASMQSLNPETLKAIKRRNLPLEKVVGMAAELQQEEESMRLFSELIVGLPGETAQSHLDAMKQMVDAGADLFNYNLHLLPGTEMETQESRADFIRKTRWRLHDNAFGIYEGERVFEGQEVVVETTTMSYKELREFRFIHFLIQFMWGRKWYFDLLNYYQQQGIHPVDAIVAIKQAFAQDQGEMGQLYADFWEDYALESFEDSDSLFEYWKQDAPFERLRTGDYGKLNYLFSYKILLDHFDSFNRFLLNFSQELANSQQVAGPENFLTCCKEILRFGQAKRLEIGPDRKPVARKELRCELDLHTWQRSGYQKSLQGPPTVLELYLKPEQSKTIELQLAQFYSEDIGRTLRKMSENTRADQFFYHVRPLS